jgi:hypothetical protein
LAAALSLLAPAALAQPGDAALKAKYLRNLAEFVEWPREAFANQAAPLVIGVVGDDQVLSKLGELEVCRVAGRTVEIRAFDWKRLIAGAAELDAQLRTCHILFIGQEEVRVVPLIFNRIKGASVLTVGDSSGFTRTYYPGCMCGIVDFFEAAGSLHLQVNLDAAERARLKFNSQLLRLVKVLRPEEARPRSAK